MNGLGNFPNNILPNYNNLPNVPSNGNMIHLQNNHANI